MQVTRVRVPVAAPIIMECTVCKTDKSEDEFHWRNKAKGIRWKRCKACKAEIDRLSYQRPGRKQRIQQTQEQLRQRNKNYVREYLLAHPCVDCGEADPIVLEFDHLRDKEDIVANLVHLPASINRIQREIDKCQVRCANCHRRITHMRRSS